MDHTKPSYIDLSHSIVEGLSTYPGLPAPQIIDSIGPEHLDGLDLARRAVLFRTDHSRHFGTPPKGSASPKIEGLGTFTVRAYATV